eukprot:TRINITY_DN4202_c0_g2_i2.p2 TRINITY_DN4202_c0_g2~~TRINITY_DN4202_c0_g2_i2.p2  ORF type:complete len:136 (+),score=17.48 TRINITY_DN4202_c0_g2_i2:67-474(+)
MCIRDRLYLRLGKICRILELPENFHLPLGQILDMWSLFAKYEGLDKTGDYHVFTVPTILDKKFQGQLYFEKESKKLRKVSSHAFEFVVDKFDACTFHSSTHSHGCERDIHSASELQNYECGGNGPASEHSRESVR